MAVPDLAQHSQDIMESYKAGTLLDDLCDRFNYADQDALGSAYQLCIDLHNRGEIDLLSVIDTPEFALLTTHRFFLAQHALCGMISRLNATLDKMMLCVLALVEKGGHDLAANHPYSAFQEWCEADPSRARQIVNRSKAGDQLAQQFLTFALVAGQFLEDAIQFIELFRDERRLCGITALNRMRFDENTGRKRAMDSIAQSLDTEVDDVLRANALAAFLNIAVSAGLSAEPQTTAIVARICVSPGPQIHYCCASILFNQGKVLPENIIAILFDALVSVDPSHKGTIDLLDVALGVLLKTKHVDAAMTFIKILLLAHDVLTFKSFESFGHALFTEAHDQFRQTLVDWLLNGKHVLCKWLHDLVQSVDREMVLDLSDKCREMTSQEQLFLSKKAIGYFFLEGQTAASILVSVLRVCDKATAASIRDLLTDVVLVNYADSVQTYLNNLGPEDEAASHIKIAIKRHEKYLNEIKSVGELKELHPSERHRQIERLRRFDQNRKMVRDAHNMSVFRDLVHRSSILYGRRSMSFVKGPNDEQQLFRMDLHEHGFSIELPRMEIIDPITLAFILFSFRAEKAKN